MHVLSPSTRFRQNFSWTFDHPFLENSRPHLNCFPGTESVFSSQIFSRDQGQSKRLILACICSSKTVAPKCEFDFSLQVLTVYLYTLQLQEREEHVHIALFPCFISHTHIYKGKEECVHDVVLLYSSCEVFFVFIRNCMGKNLSQWWLVFA